MQLYREEITEEEREQYRIGANGKAADKGQRLAQGQPRLLHGRQTAAALSPGVGRRSLVPAATPVALR